MFDHIMEKYKELSSTDKKNEIIKEVKEMIVVFDTLCSQYNVSYHKIKSAEVLDLKKTDVTEDDYYEALFVYINYLKEEVGSFVDYILDNLKNRNV